jgi:hypothetical protein
MNKNIIKKIECIICETYDQSFSYCSKNEHKICYPCLNRYLQMLVDTV